MRLRFRRERGVRPVRDRSRGSAGPTGLACPHRRRPHSDRRWPLPPSEEARWRRWIELYNRLRLPEKTYRGELYDIGFDRPEAHVVEDAGTLYYAFYAEQWRGPIELRGLGESRYAVTDYYNGRTLGEASRTAPRLEVAFDDFLRVTIAAVQSDTMLTGSALAAVCSQSGSM